MNRLVAVARRHWKSLVAINAVVIAIAGFGSTLVEDTWSAEAKLIIPNATTDLNVNLGTLGDLQGGEGLIFSQQLDSRKILVAIMLSDDTVRPVWRQDPTQEEFSDLNSFKSTLDAETNDASTVISLSAAAEVPEISKVRLQNWISAFQQRLEDLRKNDVAQRASFFEKELVNARKNLELAQQNLVAFQETTNLVDIDSQTQELVQTISTLSRMQGETTAQFTASQARLSTLTQRIGQTPDQAIRALELEENQGYQAVRQKLAEVEVALLESQAMFTNEHPQVQYLIDKRNQLLSQQAQYIDQATQQVVGVNPSVGESFSALMQKLILAESETQALQGQAAQLQNQIDDLNNRLGRIPEVQARLVELQRQYNNAEGVHNGLVAQMQAIQIDAFSAYPSVQVLDQPDINPLPIGPGKKPIMLGAILAALFGSIALVLFLEGKDPLISTNNIYSLNLPIIGQVPYLRTNVVLDDARLGDQLEFQQLALAVSKMSLRQQRLLISSPASGEGKTTITLGLAIALSVLGFRVLLVDGDTINRDLSRRLGIKSSALSHKEVQLFSISHQLDLLLLTLEEGRAKKFFMQNEFNQCLDDLQTQNQYDYVLIDTLPVSTHSETALMLDAIHHVMLVLWPYKSLKHPLYRSLELLQQHNVETSSLILNGISDSTRTNIVFSSADKEEV